MRIRISSVARLLVGLVALCLILGGANWVRTGHAPHGDAVPHFEATAAVSQVWVADQPSSTSSVSAGLQFGPVPIWTAAIVSLWLGLYCGRWAGCQRRGRSRRAPSPTEALVGVVELRL